MKCEVYSINPPIQGAGKIKGKNTLRLRATAKSVAGITQDTRHSSCLYIYTSWLEIVVRHWFHKP